MQAAAWQPHVGRILSAITERLCEPPLGHSRPYSAHLNAASALASLVERFRNAVIQQLPACTSFAQLAHALTLALRLEEERTNAPGKFDAEDMHETRVYGENGPEL